MRPIVPEGVAAPVGGYSHGVVFEGEMLAISGQTPEDLDGHVAAEPVEQLRQVWRNVIAVLDAAGAGTDDLVHVRTYLASGDHAAATTQVRQAVLGAHAPALTVVVCDLFDPGWVAEIEALARLPRASA